MDLANFITLAIRGGSSSQEAAVRRALDLLLHIYNYERLSTFTHEDQRSCSVHSKKIHLLRPINICTVLCIVLIAGLLSSAE